MEVLSSSTYQEVVRNQKQTSSWEIAVIESIEKNLLDDYNELEHSLRKLAQNLEFPLLYLGFLRKLSFLFSHWYGNEEYKEKMASLYSDLKCLIEAGVGGNIEIISAYERLASLLAGQNRRFKDPLIAPSGCVVMDPDGRYLHHQIPHLSMQAEVALVYALIARLEKREEAAKWSAQIAQWVLGSLDHHQRPCYAMWSELNDHDPFQYGCLLCALFSEVHQFSNQGFWQTLAEAQMKQIHAIAKTDCESDFPLLVAAQEVLQAKVGNPTYRLNTKMALPSDKTLGYISHREKSRTCSFKLTGYQTGLGCVHMDGIRLVNFGPMSTEYLKLSTFGVDRLPTGDGEELEDVLMEREVDAVSLSGWIRTQEEEGRKQLFSKCQMHYQNSILDLKVDAFSRAEESGFAFFVDCDQITIDGEEVIHTGSPNKYHGKARSLWCQGEHEQIQILPYSTFQEVTVMPLAGGNHFWGARFVIHFLKPHSAPEMEWKILFKN